MAEIVNIELWLKQNTDTGNYYLVSDPSQADMTETVQMVIGD